MAVRFGIALAKEEYDLTNGEVLDQIYWYVMFILSTPKWFGSCLRHHVYKIAEHTFILFKRSLLKSLDTLNHRSKKEARKLLLTKEKQDFSSDEENNSSLGQTFELDSDYESQSEGRTFSWFRHRSLRERQNLLLHRIYESENYDWFRFWRRRAVNEDDLLEPTYRRILEIMYERLQYSICQNAITEIRQESIPEYFKQRRFSSLLSFHAPGYELLPKSKSDIFKHELVQEDIRALILEELCILTPKIKQKYDELLEEIREFQPDPNQYWPVLFDLLSGRRFETMQESALSHELLLEKFHQDASVIVRRMERCVLDRLYAVALQQLYQWSSTRLEIAELHSQLNSYQGSDKSLWTILQSLQQRYPNPVQKQYRIPVHKPLPKCQYKYSTR